jgi:hemolysin activation/secretion protein
LDGAAILSQRAQKQLLKPYLNTPITFADIDLLIKDITNNYIKRGYITTRVYLKPQNITHGNLQITVVESAVESLKITENAKPRTGAPNAIPNLNGKKLNIRDLEQGIDQINRLSAYNATINITPGSEDGKSAIMIETQKYKRWGASASLDNYGSKTTGKNETEFNTNFDDLLGIYDAISFNYKSSLTTDQHQKHLQTFTTQAGVPFGYWSARYMGSAMKYLSTTNGRVMPIHLSGTCTTNRLEIERILYRDNVSKIGAALALSKRDSRNYSEGLLLAPSTNIVTILDAKLFQTRRLFQGRLNTSLTYSKGLTILGATRDTSIRLQNNGPRAQFRKLKLDCSFTQPLQFNKNILMWNLQASYQYAPHALFSDDKLSIGNHQTVAGFQGTGLSGETGAYIRNSLTWNLRKATPNSFLGGLDTFVGFDLGRIMRNYSENQTNGTLVGTTAGLRLNGGFVFGELAAAKPLSKPNCTAHDGILVNFKVGVNL